MELLTVVIVSAAMIAFVLVPGLMLSFAFFPKTEELSNIERIGVSLCLGLTPVLLLYALDKNFSVPINTYTTAGIFFFVSLIGYFVWWLRKTRLRNETR